MNYIITTQTEHELMHSGVKGMKWGVIRWKNKRYDSQMKKAKENQKMIKAKEQLKAKKDKLNALTSSNASRKKALKSNSKPNERDSDSTKRKSPADEVKAMSNEALKAKVSRLQLEQQYVSMMPKHTSKGKAFINRVANNVLIPAAEEVGKNYVKSALNNVIDKKKKK